MSVSVKQPKFMEAHGKGPRGCVLWDNQGKDLITAGSDSRLLIHRPGAEPFAPSVLHTKAVTSLAFSPNGLLLASASLDHSVKLYSYPGATFQNNVTRFNLPIRALAFSVTGGLLAAAGDDDGIKLISTVDNSIVRVMKAHGAPVVSLAFDPKNEFLASVDTDGTLIYWSLDSGQKIHTLKHAAPDVDIEDACVNQIAWHPSGDVLAVPGHQFDVVMYDRDTAEVHFRMRGGHNTSIGFLAWSPNGKYLATSGEDRKIMLWDAEKKLDLDRLKVSAQVCSLAWKPTGNSLALIDVEGKYGVWEDAIPSHLPSPSDLGQTTSLVTKKELLHFSDDEDDKATGSESEEEIIGAEVDLADDDSDEEEMMLKKEFGGQKFGKGATREVSQVKDSSIMKVKKERKPDSLHDTIHRAPCPHKPSPEKQASFQPGVTQQTAGTRRFLAYNLLGCIITSEGDGVNHIEVEFHDTSRGHRIAPLSDYFGFTMAALSEKGSVLANPQKDETPSTLVYRPFTSWASNSEWSMRFPPTEEVKAVAVGDGWVAAATSLDYLRIYSESGQQRFLFSLIGPVVTMTSERQLLAIVMHASDPMVSGQQVMNYMVLNIPNKQQVSTGSLLITPGAKLTWLGFSESGSLSTFDSKGVLRVLSRMYGGCWIPIFSVPEEQQSDSETIWMVGLNETQIFCIKCKAPEVQPQVHPKPVLSIVSPLMPLAHSDLGSSELENELMFKSFLLDQARTRADEAAAVDAEDDDNEEQILKTEAEQDRCLLRLIAACCHGDKLARALELASMLSLHKSLEGAIKLVTAMRLPSLAERLYNLLEGRKTAEREAASRVQPKENFPRSSLSISDASLREPQVHHFPSAKYSRPGSEPNLDRSRVGSGAEVPVRFDGQNVDQEGSVPTTEAKYKETSQSEQATQGGSANKSTSEHRPASSFAKTPHTIAKPINPFAKPKQGESTSLGDEVSVLTAIKNLQTAVGIKRKAGGREKTSEKKSTKVSKVA